MEADRHRVTRLSARNYRSLRDVELELGDLTVLVGRNAAGKSNVVDVLRFIRDGARGGLERALSYREGVDAVIATSSETSGVSAVVAWPDVEIKIGVEVRRDGPSEITLFVKQSWMGEWERVKGVPREHVTAVVDSSFYDLSAGPLRKPQRVGPPSPLQEDGGNLTSTLRAVLDGPDAGTLRQSLRQLVEGVDDIEVTAVAGHLVAELVYIDTDSKPRRSDLGLESDGTVQLVALLAALYQSPPPSLVAVEEPERNIHPGALGVLADVIREASTRMQVLVTTHSPDLIDHFDPDDIRVVERVEGATTIGKIDATQREAVRTKLFSTGELLRMEGLHREGV